MINRIRQQHEILQQMDTVAATHGAVHLSPLLWLPASMLRQGSTQLYACRQATMAAQSRLAVGFQIVYMSLFVFGDTLPLLAIRR